MNAEIGHCLFLQRVYQVATKILNLSQNDVLQFHCQPQRPMAHSPHLIFPLFFFSLKFNEILKMLRFIYTNINT